MLKLSEEQIKSIAEDLDLGFNCFVHKISLEIIALPNESNYPGMEFDAWKKDFIKVEKDINQYIEIYPMESTDSFNIMVDFTNQLENETLKLKLESALTRKKPFSNFKFAIDNSGKFRQQWFDFKAARLQDWVREQLNIQQD